MSLKDQNDISKENDINKDEKSIETDLENNKYYDLNLMTKKWRIKLYRLK